MKNVMISILVYFLSNGLVYANSYESAMANAIEKLNTSKDFKSYLEAISAFERIATKEDEKWLPFYYAGLGYIRISHTAQDGSSIDAYLDKAQEFVSKADKLSPNNDEIITLQGYIYMMKVAVDPSNRGPQFSGMAMQKFGKAVGMNQNNPRALLLLGRMQMGADQFFGNDISESCGMILKASQMFEEQIPTSKLDPSWGEEMAKMFVYECNSK